MAFVIADRVRETSTTIGTGNFTLAGAVTGYQTFDAALDTGDTTYYTIADQSGVNWEVGIGTFTSPATLARTTILSSSNGGSAVTFTSGTKDVFISLPASKTVQSFSAGSTGLTPSTASFGAVALAGTLVPANGGTGTATAFTAGSVVFAGASGVYAQDNASLFFDDTNNRLGIGTVSPDASLTVNTIASFGAGAAALPSIAAKGDLNTGVWFPAADTIAASTGGSERLRIDSSGNVGIGTSVATAARLVVTSPANSPSLVLTDATQSTLTIKHEATNLLTYEVTGTAVQRWVGNSVERMRIDSSGNLLVGLSASAAIGGRLSAAVSGNNAGVFICDSANFPLVAWARSSSSELVYFGYGSGGGNVGTITTNGTTTSYNVTSDYRLKRDVKPLVSGLSTVAALKPCIYKWSANNSYGEGFIAHELQTVIPEAVSGEKDAINKDGSIKPQGVDYSKIVVHLVAAIQELSAKVAALEVK
jgi:hypothetical protein